MFTFDAEYSLTGPLIDEDILNDTHKENLTEMHVYHKRSKIERVGEADLLYSATMTYESTHVNKDDRKVVYEKESFRL